MSPIVEKKKQLRFVPNLRTKQIMVKTKAATPTTREMLRDLQRSREDSKKEIAALKKRLTLSEKKMTILYTQSKQAFKQLHHRYLRLNTENVELKAKCNKLEINMKDMHVHKESELFLAHLAEDPVLGITPLEYEFWQQQLPDDYKDGGEIRL